MTIDNEQERPVCKDMYVDLIYPSCDCGECTASIQAKNPSESQETRENRK